MVADRFPFAAGFVRVYSGFVFEIATQLLLDREQLKIARHVSRVGPSLSTGGASSIMLLPGVSLNFGFLAREQEERLPEGPAEESHAQETVKLLSSCL